MTTRTSRKTVTFTRPFFLSGIDEVRPAGTYAVETDEELLQALSFPAYRRVATWIRLPSPPGSAALAALHWLRAGPAFGRPGQRVGRPRHRARAQGVPVRRTAAESRRHLSAFRCGSSWPPVRVRSIAPAGVTVELPGGSQLTVAATPSGISDGGHTTEGNRP